MPKKFYRETGNFAIFRKMALHNFFFCTVQLFITFEKPLLRSSFDAALMRWPIVFHSKTSRIFALS
jgi:hypothetical protein